MSDFLADRSELSAADVLWAVGRGDPIATELLTTASHRAGEALARLVSFVNPSMVIVGGGLPAAGDVFLAGVREKIYSQSLPLTTRTLRVERSELGSHAGLVGAAYAAADDLFSRRYLPQWIYRGSPAGMRLLALPS